MAGPVWPCVSVADWLLLLLLLLLRSRLYRKRPSGMFDCFL